jgi:SAM-dependent methyltransferase
LLTQPGEQEQGVPQAVCANGVSLPFADATFDMVYCQLVLLWARPVESVIREVWRVLQPGGVVIAVEPDYGGMIEYPPALATRDLWIAALKRAGATPTIGRMLPGMFARQGFRVRVDLLPELVPPSPTRFALLRGLPLTSREHAKLRHIEQQDAAMGDGDDGQQWARVIHLPFVLITAERVAQ